MLAVISNNIKISKLFAFVCILCIHHFSAFASEVDLADLVEKNMPAVVDITTRQKVKSTSRFGGNQMQDLLKEWIEKEFGISPYGDSEDQKASYLGSGFIISDDGLIVTNNHVLGDSSDIEVSLHGLDGKSYKAEIVGKDSATDLALLKIKAEKKLHFLQFGDSDVARIGEKIFVIGNPFGLGGSVTAGIISAKGRDLAGLGQLNEFIQVDAAINVGNSGGPLFNMSGDVIGVNSIIISPSKGNVGVGFAIPSNTVKSVIMQLKESGEVKRGRMGVTIQDMSDKIAKDLGLGDHTKGALVGFVMSGSPADKAGIKVGDLIVKFDDQKITSSSQLKRLASSAKIGKKVEIEVLRDGKIRKMYSTVDIIDDESTDPSFRPSSKANAFGINVQNLNQLSRSQYGLTEDDVGVVVSKVDRGSVAAFAGIKVGDVIKSVNKVDIRNIKAFDKIIEKVEKDAAKNNRKSATFLIMRNKNTFFVSLEAN